MNRAAVSAAGATTTPRRIVTRGAAVAVLGGFALIFFGGFVFSRMADIEFIGFLAALVGGWLLSFVLAGVLLAVPGRRGVALHVVTVALLSVVLWWLSFPAADLIPLLPEAVIPFVVALQFAGLTFAGWQWMCLISRASQAARRPAIVRVGPEWERLPSVSRVSFPGVAVTQRRLAWTIAAAAVTGGVIIVLVLILTGDTLLGVGPRFALVVGGLVLGLPLYALVMWVLRRHQVDCEIDVGDDRFVVRRGDDVTASMFDDIERLVWGGAGENARVQIVERSGREIAISVGLARVPKGRAASLPPLQKHMRRRLELAGLVERKPKRPADRGMLIDLRRRPRAASGRLSSRGSDGAREQGGIGR